MLDLIKRSNLVLFLILMCILLSACGPSPEELAATSAAETAAAATSTPTITPTFTPTFTLTPTSTPTPTPTPTLTPTPDLRVIDADPRLLLLSAEDLPEDSGYFSTGDSSQRNWEIARDYGDEIAKAYIEASGRIDGWSRVLKTYSTLPNIVGQFGTQIVIFSKVDAFDFTKVYQAGILKTTQLGIDQVTGCNLLNEFQENKPIDISENAHLCYIHLDYFGTGFIDYYNVYGSYSNILFSVTITGPENTLSEDIVIDLAKILVRKIKSFPLTGEVTYTP